MSVLRGMCSGLERCMYCEDSVGTDIDHFWPKSGYPGRTFDWDNHLLACSTCNSNAKRDRFPVESTGDPLLINPIEDEPRDHIVLSPSTGLYQPLSPKGEASIDVFRLNRDVCARGRMHAWVVLLTLCCEYASCRDKEDRDAADVILSAIAGHPFQGVREQMLMVFQSARELIPERARSALERYSELLTF